MDIPLAGESNQALNEAVQAVINAGISVTAAAGDYSADASGYSPGQGEQFYLEGELSKTDVAFSRRGD